MNKQFFADFDRYLGNYIVDLYKKKLVSYIIPKEEQIRSLLFAYLIRKKYIVEVESDFFDHSHYRRGEFDLCVLNGRKISFIEIKRATAIGKDDYIKKSKIVSDWNNDYPARIQTWEKDMLRLENEFNHSSRDLDTYQKDSLIFLGVCFFNRQGKLYVNSLVPHITNLEQSHKKWKKLYTPKTRRLTESISMVMYIFTRTVHN